jgi:transposase
MTTEDTKRRSGKASPNWLAWPLWRRKFFDLHAAGGHPVAQEVLRRIGELYAIETLARDSDVSDRLALRQQHVTPKLTALRDWLIAQRVKTADGTGLARAIDYSLKRLLALMRYVDNGALPIDNNPAYAAFHGVRTRVVVRGGVNFVQIWRFESH